MVCEGFNLEDEEEPDKENKYWIWVVHGAFQWLENLLK